MRDGALQRLMHACGPAAVLLALATPGAVAEELRNHDVCREAVRHTPETLDRDGHTLSIGTDSCETVEGATKGAVWQESNVWEWDGPKAKELSGYAIGRKLGATQVCNELPEKATLDLIVTDGKVTGWKASGQCVVTLATGEFGPMLGKIWYWNFKSTGPLTSENDSTIR